MTQSNRQDPIALIAANRRAFRNLGATSQTLQCVETYFRIKRKRSRLSLADVGRVLGVHRSIVSRHFKRAEAIGLLIRVGATFALNARGVLRWSKDAVQQRIEAAKRRFIKEKSKKRDSRSRIIEPQDKKPANGTDDVPQWQGTRSEALVALASSYIPPHLRKAR